LNAIWSKTRAVWPYLSLLAAFVALGVVVASIFTGNMDLLTPALLIMAVSALPASYGDLLRIIRAPKPRPSPRLLLARWPLLPLPFMLAVAMGWGIGWIAFGRVWMGTLVAFGMGLPMIVLQASLYLMEPGPRKDRVYLASLVAMVTAPALMMVAFSVVYGTAGR
jgi:hypothetical protein